MKESPEEARAAVRAVRDAIANLGKFLHEEGAMLTGWVLACEWMDADGDYWMSSHTDENTPPWRARGLIGSVLEGDISQPLGEHEDDD